MLPYLKDRVRVACGPSSTVLSLHALNVTSSPGLLPRLATLHHSPSTMNKRIERELHRTKVVVRHLPCQLTEERLQEQLTSLPPHDYMYFVQGDASYNQFGYSRLYINFTSEDDIVPFKEMWDGYLFEDEAGFKTHAVVEFAPFQRVPRKNKRKPDPKCGTIQTDPEFLAFTEAYGQEVEPLPSIDKTTYMLEEPKAAAAKETTALIEYLKDKKEQKARAKAAKEAKRREKKAREKSRKEKVEPAKTSTSASMKVALRQGGRGEGGEDRGGGTKPVSATAQPQEGKTVPVKTSSTASSGHEVGSSRQSPQTREYGDEASVRIIARHGGGGGRRSGQATEKSRQKHGGSGEREMSDAGALKKTDSYYSTAGGKDSREGSQLQGGGRGGERGGRGGRGRGDKKPDRMLYNPRSKREGEGEESASGSHRGRGSGRPYYGRGRGRGGRGGGQRYNQDKPQT